MADEKLTLTIEETSRLLGLSRGLTYEAARSGQLPVFRVGRRLLVSRAGIDRMLAEAGNAK